MRFHAILFALLAFGLLLLPRVSQGQTRDQARFQRRHATSGKVKSVDAATKSFVVTVQEKKTVQDVTVKTGPTTRFLRGAAMVGFADVQPQTDPGAGRRARGGHAREPG